MSGSWCACRDVEKTIGFPARRLDYQTLAETGYDHVPIFFVRLGQQSDVPGFVANMVPGVLSVFIVKLSQACSLFSNLRAGTRVFFSLLCLIVQHLPVLPSLLSTYSHARAPLDV